MKVISCNIGKIRTIIWRGKPVKTGITKKTVNGYISLGETDVEGDHVIDRKYHGGIDQACYLYGIKQYDYWKRLFPNIDWHYGIFGENITIDSLDESKIRTGSIYQLGTAEVIITKARNPCYKLGVIMGDQSFIKKFWDAPYPGLYLKILKKGKVKAGDKMILINENNNGKTILELYKEKRK